MSRWVKLCEEGETARPDSVASSTASTPHDRLMAIYALRPVVLLLTLLGATFLVACDDDGDDGSVVREETVQDNPDSIPGDEPLANDIPSLVIEGLQNDFGDEDWLDDVGDIERDGDTVRVTLDRDFDTDRQAFEQLCTAVAGQLMGEESLGVRKVIVENEDGEDVMRSEGSQPQCTPLAT